MILEARRIAIAEVCGWKRRAFPIVSILPRAADAPTERVLWMKPGGKTFCFMQPPDYINDLNAMHEAEKVLTALQLQTYVSHLLAMTMPHWAGHVFAPASQRAEALLRTLGKWEDGK